MAPLWTAVCVPRRVVNLLLWEIGQGHANSNRKKGMRDRCTESEGDSGQFYKIIIPMAMHFPLSHSAADTL